MKKLLLAGIAALLLSTGAAHATERLPEAMLGNWCWVEGGDEQNWKQQIFARVPLHFNFMATLASRSKKLSERDRGPTDHGTQGGGGGIQNNK